MRAVRILGRSSVLLASSRTRCRNKFYEVRIGDRDTGSPVRLPILWACIHDDPHIVDLLCQWARWLRTVLHRTQVNRRTGGRWKHLEPQSGTASLYTVSQQHTDDRLLALADESGTLLRCPQSYHMRNGWTGNGVSVRCSCADTTCPWQSTSYRF